MKNNYNTLKKYIFENSEREYRKETIEGLFRSILDPIASNQKLETLILLKLNDIEPFNSIIKRVEYSGRNIISFSDNYNINHSTKNIWGDTEFLIVLSQRYSAALIWDYSSSINKDISNICLLFNSKQISEIAKVILDNSNKDFKEMLLKYSPDRRENTALNSSINSIAHLLNLKNEDILFSENEKKQLLNTDDTHKTAEIVASKAKFIAHEIKNNLSIINLYSTILEKRLSNIKLDDDINDSVKNSIKNIKTGSENVSALINELRCLSSPYITEFNLKEFIINTVMMCEEKANKANVKIELSTIDDIQIKTDKIKLQCTLTNIIFNAIEACKNGCTVKIHTEANENISIYIENNGEIIPTNIQSRIFEPDFTTKETGNGLGLAICKKQMNLLNGDIFLEQSTKGKTIFKIVLPLCN